MALPQILSPWKENRLAAATHYQRLYVYINIFRPSADGQRPFRIMRPDIWSLGRQLLLGRRRYSSKKNMFKNIAQVVEFTYPCEGVTVLW